MISNLSEKIQKHKNWLIEKKWDKGTLNELLILTLSEVGEVSNECREEILTDKFGEEIADICLRLFGIIGLQNINHKKYLNANLFKIGIEGINFNGVSSLENLKEIILPLNNALFLNCTSKIARYRIEMNIVLSLFTAFKYAEKYNVDIENEIDKKMNKNLKLVTTRIK